MMLVFFTCVLALTKAQELNFMFLDELDSANPLERKAHSESSAISIKAMGKKSIQSLPFDINQLEIDPLNPNGPVTYSTSKHY